MTYTAELAKTAQRMEYILCIEGMGWTEERSTPIDGFNGHLFVTDDINGTLAADLGCTIHKTLNPKSAIESKIDPISCAVSFGQMSFDIVDDGYLLANMVPFKSVATDELDADLLYSATDVETVDGVYATDDVVFVGGGEAIKLGAKAGTDYSGSIRGYAGTRTGRVDSKNIGVAGMSFQAGTKISSVNRFWEGRLMRLYAHVPGEAAGACVLLWQGKLSACTIPQSGIIWSISGAGDIKGHCQPVRVAPSLECNTNGIAHITDALKDAETGLLTGSLADGNGAAFSIGGNRVLSLSGVGDSDEDSTYACATQNNWMIIKALYQYRSEPGGTDGIKSAWTTADSIQALDKTDDSNISYAMISIAGRNLRLLRGRLQDDMTVGTWSSFISENVGGWIESVDWELFEDNAPVRWLLDNFSDDYELSRFAVNHVVVRNPIDVALCFLTSMNSEFFRYDAVAAGSSGSVIVSASLIPDSTGLMWVGYALHCVEGANKGYSRPIDYSDDTYCRVNPAFPNAPADGDEYQIRNSIYDVLPITWGCCKNNAEIDIAAFETIRDLYLGDAELSRFAIGSENQIDLWDMVTRKILAPYGVAIVMDRATGKLTPAFIGDAIGDGIADNYVQVVKSRIISVGDLDMNVSDAIRSISLRVRQSWQATVKMMVWNTADQIKESGFYARMKDQSVTFMPNTDPLSGNTTIIDIVEKGYTDGQTATSKSTYEVDATFNTQLDCGSLVAMQIARMKLLSTPRPTTTLVLDVSLYESVREGMIVAITYDDAPANPFTGARGWNALAARVLGISMPLVGELGFTVTVELLDDLSGGKVAPAAIITSTDFIWPDIGVLVVESNKITYDDGTIKDMHYFEVGDLVDAYNKNGVSQHSAVIVSFGSNEVADPTLADTQQINIDPVYAGWAAGDYVSFSPWDTAQTARMNDYAAQADNTTGLLDAADSAKEYV